MLNFNFYNYFQRASTLTVPMAFKSSEYGAMETHLYSYHEPQSLQTTNWRYGKPLFEKTMCH